MDQSRKPTWQPITALPLVAAAITGMLEGTREQHRLLIEARQRPYVLDDHTVAGVVRVYGAQAGNFALEGLALGGVIVGGGIAPKIQAKLADGRFMKAFRAKGRLDTLLASVSVRVALDPRAPLWGAARLATLMHTS